MFRNKGASLFFGSVIFIFIAMAVITVIDKTKSNSSTDVRARASGVNTLQFIGTFDSIDPISGGLIVNNLYMSDKSRVADAKDMGTWTVAPPANFNTATLSPGMTIEIGIDPKTFLAKSHSLTALSVTVKP